MTARQAFAPRAITGRHVLAALLGFFGLVFIANGAFVYFALDSWTGRQEDYAADQAHSYQEQRDDASAQAARGWRLDVTQASTAPGRLHLELRLHDRHGAPVDGVGFRAQLRRPTSAAFDQPVVFSPQGLGRYAADIAVAGPGQWDLWLETQGHEGVPHRHRQRLWIAP